MGERVTENEGRVDRLTPSHKAGPASLPYWLSLRSFSRHVDVVGPAALLRRFLAVEQPGLQHGRASL